MYTLTYHASMRIRERQLSAEELAVAVAGRRIVQYHGREIVYDPRTRCAVVVAPFSMVILTAFLTAFRLKKKQIKRYCSR